MAPAPRPPGTLAWIDLSTPDLDTATRFYQQLFSWTLESSPTPMGRYVVGSVDDGPVGGMMAMPAAPGPPPAWTVFFATDDLDTAYTRAQTAGATGLQPPMQIPGGDRIAVLTDPAGAVVGLMQSAQPGGLAWGVPGAVAWVETATRDLDTSRVFYEQIFGWTAVEGANRYWVFEHHGEQVAGMMTMPEQVPGAVPSYWMPYLAVWDVDHTCVRAVDLGATVVAAPMSVEAMRFAVLEDPGRAVFGVLQTPSDAP
ncbi:VOC family protein [Rhodococcus ruber]|uniref:VOC family protein n=1 Tax=Rhodococcus ruber TaxID=1830 RepID=UPI00111DF5C9|nr:VOC family protein [Rhodococcus ruber]QDC17399.1 VOC family protein [Rhodococcus ruber]